MAKQHSAWAGYDQDHVHVHDGEDDDDEEEEEDQHEGELRLQASAWEPHHVFSFRTLRRCEENACSTSPMGLRTFSAPLEPPYAQVHLTIRPLLVAGPQILQAMGLSQRYSREVNALYGHKASGRIQRTRVQSTHFLTKTL